MRLIGPSSVDEMVLAFIRAEADGPRHHHAYAHLDRQLIDQPDLTDPAQNRTRAEAVAAYRGGYIGPLPADTSWQRWAVTPAELGDVRYANFDTWLRLSERTRRIRDGAANVHRVQVFENGHDINAGIRDAARAVDRGNEIAELIAVAQAPDARSLVLLEGHTRATAYLVAGKPPAEVTVLVGWSRSMNSWPWF